MTFTRFSVKNVASLLDRHRQRLDDVPAAESVVEHLVGVAAALAYLADADDIGHEAQAGVRLAEPVAVGAGALRVRAEEGGLDAVRLGEGGPDRVEDAGVGGGVRASRATDGGLVDHGHRVRIPGQAAVNEGALARAGNACHRDQHAEWDVDRDVLEVVEAGVVDGDRALRGPAAPASALGGRPDDGRSPFRRRRGHRRAPRTRPSRHADRRRAPCR